MMDMVQVASNRPDKTVMRFEGRGCSGSLRARWTASGKVSSLDRTPRDLLNLRGDRLRSAPRPEVLDGRHGDQRGGVA